LTIPFLTAAVPGAILATPRKIQWWLIPIAIENCRMLNAPKSWAAARPDHFDSPGYHLRWLWFTCGTTVFLGNLILHPWRVRKTKSQRVRHRRAARNDDSGTAFEVPAGLNWDMRLSAYIQLFLSLLNSSSTQ